MILFGLLWKRSKYRRRRSGTSTTSANTGFTSSLNNPVNNNSLCSARSVTPIINHIYCNDDGEAGLEPLEVDTISALDYPTSGEANQHNVLEKYTLEAVDRMCWEVIRGATTPNVKLKEKGQRKKNSYKQTDSNNQVVKTLSNASHKSQASSGYCSSGYCSSGTSSAPNSATISRSRSSEW